MSDPCLLKPYRDQVWVAHLAPPLFLDSTLNPSPKEAEND